ncbi:MAG: substrate-binding domain-containing protein [Propioniciclava sp.]
MRSKKHAIVMAGIGSVTLALAACSGTPQGSSIGDPDQDSFTYVAISKSLNNPAFTVAETGAQARAQELGNVTIEWVAPADADPAKEAQMIEGYVQRGVDGLLINSLGPSVCSAVDQAVAAGIPVVMWDSDCPDSTRTAYVGSDNYKGGLKAAELYAAATADQGHQKIAILTGVPGSFNLGERDRGFIDGLDEAGLDYEIATTVPGHDDLTKSVDAVESTLQGDPSINGFYFDGPWPLLVEQAALPVMIERVKAGELTVVGFDTLEATLSYAEDELVVGLVGQKYYGWGYQGVTVIHEIVANGATYPEIIDTGLDIVTPDGEGDMFTPQEMAAMWESEEFDETPLMPEDVA